MNFVRVFGIETIDEIELEGVTIRDEMGIFRIASGMAKILFPDKKFDEDELKLIMDLAIEYRQKLADLLHRMAPGSSRGENKL